MTLNETQDAIIEEFSRFDDWLDAYEYIIGFGRKNGYAHEGLRSEEYLMPGCLSQVWLRTDEKEGNLHFFADSDSLIITGIISLVLKVLNGRAPDEIVNADLYFLHRTGLTSGLSPTKQNSLAVIVSRIKAAARTFTD